MSDFSTDYLDQLLKKVAATPGFEEDTVDRIASHVLSDWDQRSRNVSTKGYGTRLSNLDPHRLRAPLVSLLVAMAIVIVVLIHIFLPASNESAIAGWHNTDGRSRNELRSLFSHYAAIQKSPDTLPIGARASHEVDAIPTPSYKGFDIRSDSKFYDMTWWRRVDPDRIQSGRFSPVVFTRVLELRRIPGDPENRQLRFKFWTSGFAVDPVKIKSTDTVTQARQREVLHKDGKPMRTCLLSTDVSEYPEGSFFTIVVHAVYWNGFNDLVRENAATAIASANLVDADIGVLLPPEHSLISEWALYRIPAGSGKDKERSPENRFKAGHPPRDESGILYWPIARAESDCKYMMEWDWARNGDAK